MAESNKEMAEGKLGKDTKTKSEETMDNGASQITSSPGPRPAPAGSSAQKIDDGGVNYVEGAGRGNSAWWWRTRGEVGASAELGVALETLGGVRVVGEGDRGWGGGGRSSLRRRRRRQNSFDFGRVYRMRKKANLIPFGDVCSLVCIFYFYIRERPCASL